MKIETKAGTLTAHVQGERVAVAMTEPTQLRLGLSVSVASQRMRLGFVDTGVPHVVVPVRTLDRLDVGRLGRLLRQHPRFAPQGTNVNFMQTDSRHPDHVRIRTYERGVEDETLACGTGVTAAAVIHAATTSNGHALARRVRVTVQSGDVLTVSMAWRPANGRQRVTNVILEGPAQRICDGTVTWPLGGAR